MVQFREKALFTGARAYTIRESGTAAPRHGVQSNASQRGAGAAGKGFDSLLWHKIIDMAGTGFGGRKDYRGLEATLQTS